MKSIKVSTRVSALSTKGVTLLASLTTVFALVLLPAMGARASTAFAAVAAPGLTVDSFASPTVFSETHNAKCLESAGVTCDAYQVTVTNAGGAASLEGAPIVMKDVVPAGLTVQSIALIWSAHPSTNFGGLFCNTAEVRCSFPAPLQPDDRLEMIVNLTVNSGTAGQLEANKVKVSGGGAPAVGTEELNTVGPAPAKFGVSEFGFFISGSDGRPDSQAGDHPYELTTTIGLNNMFREPPDISGGLGKTSVEDIKDVVVDLPLGFVGSTLAAPECTLAQLSSETACPDSTVVGHLFGEPVSGTSVDSPIWNLVPEHGVPAEFGYRDALRASHVFYSRVVPTPGGYVLEVTNPDVPEVSLTHIIATFYGNPAGRARAGNAPIPFFTNPTICGQVSLTASIHIDSWSHPGRFSADGTPDFSDPNWASATSTSSPPTGCNRLQFTPELKAQPTTNIADSPSGLDFELKLAQSEDAGSLATPPLKRAVVTLPPGFTIDPSAGDGLEACSEAQIGWTGPSLMNFNAAQPTCPEPSKIGTIELETPLIPGLLTGEMYLARQNENPFGSVLAAYVVVNDPKTGVLIKIAGQFTPDPNTGQITSIFDENPQLPFSDLKLHFFGGPRAELATPEDCGLYTIASQVSPWSAPDSGADATPFDSFLINSGCVNGFNPGFTGGSTNLQAGAYTPFVASFARSDTDQELAGLSVTLPAGLLATITGVPLCPEPNASNGSCPETTKVGTVTAGAGPGPNPLFVTGNAYLTGPYHGAPYGLSVVVPAVAGPFNFGNVIVRQALRIDPITARVTDISDPFPTILRPTGANGQTIGVPIRLRRIDVNINRPSFTFNPTSCNKLSLSASINSLNATSSELATPFQVTNCAALRFTPRISVTTAARTSKANGSSLVFRISYPSGAMGSQAWFNEAKFDLPKQLPARLTTIQKACLASVFDANPAACPPASLIGHAVVRTPVLPDPLAGPVYFVSHGGAKFPDAVVVLQGDGVKVNLTGETFINGKTGITSATFRNTPDVPFESIVVTVPQGPFSEFGSNLPAKARNSFCGQKLVMPTFFKASNGLEVKQNTRVGVTGCPKAKKHGKAQKRRRHHGKKAGHGPKPKH